MVRGPIVFLIALLICLPAAAETISFDSLPSGPHDAVEEVPSARLVTTSNGTIFIYDSGDYGMPDGGGICALALNYTCTGKLTVLFIGPVADLTFKGYFAQTHEGGTASVYSGTTQLASRSFSGTASGTTGIDFSGVSGITRLAIETSGGGSTSGIAYGNFNYTPGPPDKVVPPPTTGWRSLDFNGFRSGMNAAALEFDDLIVSGRGDARIFVYHGGDWKMPPTGGFCALMPDFTCTGTLQMAFFQPITDLTFKGFFAKPADAVFVSLFLGKTLVTSQLFFGNDSGTVLFDFSGIDKIDFITIEDRSSRLTKGMAFGDFRYRYWTPPSEVPPAAVPLPTSGSLGGVLMLCLGALSIRRSRLRRGNEARGAI